MYVVAPPGIATKVLDGSGVSGDLDVDGYKHSADPGNDLRIGDWNTIFAGRERLATVKCTAYDDSYRSNGNSTDIGRYL